MQVGVPKDRVLLRLPATWEGIEATRALEADGCRCLVHMVFSFAQARAAAEAGASVIQARAPAPRTPWVALADPGPLSPLTCRSRSVLSATFTGGTPTSFGTPTAPGRTLDM